MEKLIKVVSFNERPPADAVAESLKSSGIEAFVHDESGQQNWQLWNLEPRAHLQVKVGGEDEERAAALIKEWIAEGGPAASAVQCPECGSLRVEYPQFSRKTLIGALPAALAAAGVIERDYFCESCNFTWPPEPPAAEPERDILNWEKK